MDTATRPRAGSSDPFALGPEQRTQVVIVLAVVLVVLVTTGLVLDRITTQTKHFAGEFAHPAVPFPREMRDDFTRSGPDAGRLGNAPNGQRWIPLDGTWGTADHAARVIRTVPGQPSYAVAEVGAGPGSLSVTATHVGAGMGLAFRCQSELTCWTLTASPQVGTWRLTEINGGETTDFGNIGTAPVADGTRIRVDLGDSGFDVVVNGVLQRHVDSTDLNDQTRAGLVLEATGDVTARWSEFRSLQRNIVGPDAPVRDDFDRRQGTGLRRATTGERWSEVGGEWGVRQGDAVLISAPGLRTALATIDIGSGDGWVQVSATTFPTGMGLVFRYHDASNYWWVDAVPDAGAFNVFKMVNGRVTKVAKTRVTTFGAGSTLAVRLHGDEIGVFVNGRATELLVHRHAQPTIASSDLRRAHRAGLEIDSPDAVGARYAGFAAGPLSIAG